MDQARARALLTGERARSIGCCRPNTGEPEAAEIERDEDGRAAGAEARVMPWPRGGAMVSVPGRRPSSSLRGPAGELRAGAGIATCWSGSSKRFGPVRAGPW
jgi:hypothetical protein